MIAYLRGTVLDKRAAAVVIESGGVGRTVEMTRSHLADFDVGGQVGVHTVTVVRPECVVIYGFPSADDVDVFEVLRGVSGVGPRSALAALETLGVEAIAGAVDQNDVSVIRKVQGIGPTTARMVVMSLRGKLTGYAPDKHATTAEPSPIADPMISVARIETLGALTELGWSRRDAILALDAVCGRDQRDIIASVPYLLRAALAELGPER